MRPSTLFSILLLTASGWLLDGAPLGARDTPEPASGGGEEFFVDRLDVNVVNVEVYVTDKDGNRVTGLTRDDFEIFEDDRPMKITNFYAVADSDYSGVEQPGVIQPEVRDRAAPPEPRRAEIPESQQLHLIVYIDNLHIRPFNRNRVLRAVRNFLRTKVDDGTRVMLVTFERSLHVREVFTEDVRQISDATFELETLSAFSVQKEQERDNVLKRILRSDTVGEAESHADFYAKATFNDVEVSLRGLREMVGTLAGLPGRKALLYVSDGLEMIPGQDLFQLVEQEYRKESYQTSFGLQANRYSARRLYQEAIAHANANRVTFYTLEAAGLRSHSSLSADRAGGTSQIEIDFTYQMNRQEPLLMLADDTGGQSAINTNNIAGALDRMADDFGTYYSLGYVPSHGGDGRYHRIKVQVKRKGLKLRHRDGYRDKSVETRLSEGTLAALLYSVESNTISAEMVLERSVSGERGSIYLPIEVRIPIGALTLLPRAGSHHGQVRVALAAMDDDGELSPVEQVPVPIQIPESEIAVARGKYYVYSANLEIRPGRHKVAVGLRDEISGETSFLTHATYVEGG